MACTICTIRHVRCEDNCCFKKYFGPQDVKKFQKIRENNYSPKFMREKLNDDDISDEDKKRLIEIWRACFNAKGKEKKAGSSSSKNEKKELQASSNELGCKDNCFFAGFFSPDAKERIVEIINEGGMEMVETEVKLMLEKLLCRKTEAEVAAQILFELKQGDRQ